MVIINDIDVKLENNTCNTHTHAHTHTHTHAHTHTHTHTQAHTHTHTHTHIHIHIHTHTHTPRRRPDLRPPPPPPLGQEATEGYLTYVECDKKGTNSKRDMCKEKKVPGFPTWEINGEFFP